MRGQRIQYSCLITIYLSNELHCASSGVARMRWSWRCNKCEIFKWIDELCELCFQLQPAGESITQTSNERCSNFMKHIVRAPPSIEHSAKSQDKQIMLKMHLTFRFGHISSHHHRLSSPNVPLCGARCDFHASISHLNFIYLILIRFNAPLNVCSQQIFRYRRCLSVIGVTIMTRMPVTNG